jgi:chemotaxis protein methyltransferase CheR
MLTVSARALQQLASLLLERAGLKITPDGYHSLRLALTTRMPALGLEDAEEYVKRLRAPSSENELRALLPLVTVGHTEFFRDPKQFRALEQVLVPEALQRARRENRKVHIWSAGCATGEEPYSVAMVLAELGALSVEVDLWATDLNLAAVESAKQGRFAWRRTAGIPKDKRERFFRPTEDGHEVLPWLREFVRFDGQNLAVPVFEKVRPESLDLILCRNVIIYFDLPTIRALMDRFLMALRPGGVLLLGYSESLFKVYDRFEMMEVEGAFVYRRPLTLAQPPAKSSSSPGMAAQAPASRPSEVGLAAAGAKPRVTQPSLPAVPAVGQANGTNPAVMPATRSLHRTLEVTPVSATGLPAAATGEPARKSLTAPAVATTGPVPALSSASRKAEGSAPSANEARTRGGDLPAWSLSLTPAERLNAAVRMMERGDFTAAVATVEQLLADEPDDLDALLTLGNLYSITGRLADARDAFAQAINREPLCVEARVFGGLASLQAGEMTEARAELGKALFLEPSLAIGHYLIAQVYERLKDREGARRSYRNAISQLRYPQRQLAGHYPDLPDSSEALSRSARYALAALEEEPVH